MTDHYLKLYKLMIEPSELRIGNLIQGSEGVIGKVISICEDSIDTEHDYYHDVSLLSGIPLTEDWLKRAGFTMTYEVQGEHWRGYGRLLLKRNGVFCDYVSEVEFHSLHFLQNFIFFISGTELTIEL